MLDGGQSVLAIFGIAAIGVVIIIFYLFRRIKQLEMLKGLDAEHATGTLGRKLASTSGENNSVTHTIFYVFKDTKGRVVSGKHAVTPAIYETLSEGDIVPVSYLPNKPTINAHSECVDALIKRMRFIATVIIIVSISFFAMTCVIYYMVHIAG